METYLTNFLTKSFNSSDYPSSVLAKKDPFLLKNTPI